MEAKCNFFFLFFFQTLGFFRKLARVSSVFRTFPTLQNLRKHLKTLPIFQFSTSLFGLLVYNSINTIYTYIHYKIFNIYNMQNYIYIEITVVVSPMARLTAQEGTLSVHLSRDLKMFLKHTEKNEVKEPSECTFLLK